MKNHIECPKGFRFERSEDGQSWEPIDYKVMRDRLANCYLLADAPIESMIHDKREIRTNFAIYRAVAA